MANANYCIPCNDRITALGAIETLASDIHLTPLNTTGVSHRYRLNGSTLQLSWQSPQGLVIDSPDTQLAALAHQYLSDYQQTYQPDQAAAQLAAFVRQQ